ncbi:hypothetical protein Pcinc_030106 [Petrolisthes cinctipes]|uniref:Uncharacterized protein n=1 Tax=Petrolisthes cinctipes TaxID=88211 RepID=A0AAE1EZZ8_PETCI|nr:hypothetical protein Pcinc_030106 [Petrolisthes cinctipes]
MMWMTLRSLDALIKLQIHLISPPQLLHGHPGVLWPETASWSVDVGNVLQGWHWLLLYPCRVYRPDMEMLATILKELGSGVWSGQCGV